MTDDELTTTMIFRRSDMDATLAALGCRLSVRLRRAGDPPASVAEASQRAAEAVQQKAATLVSESAPDGTTRIDMADQQIIDRERASRGARPKGDRS